jgi:hypothetical protein
MCKIQGPLYIGGHTNPKGGRGARGHNMHLNTNTIIMAQKIILLFPMLYEKNP